MYTLQELSTRPDEMPLTREWMMLLKNGKNLPVDMVGQTIYYMGPSPAREGRPIGSAGPTTASRMDRYAPKLLDLGLTAMIGKGKRSKEVLDAVKRNGSVLLRSSGRSRSASFKMY